MGKQQSKAAGKEANADNGAEVSVVSEQAVMTTAFRSNMNVANEATPKLLVIGNKEEMFEPLIERLTEMKIEVFSADSSKSAIRLASQHDFFLILMGSQELRTGGIETAFVLRADENTRRIPVVFVSKSEQTVGETEESYGYGIAGADFVINPVHPDVVQKEVSVFLDMYRHKKQLELSEQMYKTMATRDPLTMLGNRDQFEIDLKKALANAKRHGYMIAVLYIDLDEFKPVNDQYGHQVGDHLLQQVADRLRFSIREGDFVGRLGGDEFAVLLNVVRDAESAGMVAGKIIESITKPYTLDDRSITIGASIGIAYYPENGDEYDTLLHKADRAMYTAKGAGHNLYRYYEAEG